MPSKRKRISYTIKTVAVIGDGGWGTTLAIHLAKKGYAVRLWGAFPDYVRQVRQTRINKKFLAGIKIPEEVQLLDNLTEALQHADLLVLAVPSQYVRSVLNRLKKENLSNKIILSVVKGLDDKNLQRISQIITEVLGSIPLAVLSGPTIAKEVAQQIPTTAVIAAANTQLAQSLQKVFHSESFRIYTNTDIIGVELGGCVKNIIAIASGVCDGLGFGTNTKAALLTRGLAEMTRLGVALGAKKETFYGLTGLGDLVTTCMSAQSRNRSVGEKLGQGQAIQNISSGMDMVAEGVQAAKLIVRLAKKVNVAVPITDQVYKIIYQHKDPKKAVEDLLAREMKSE